MNDRDDVAMPVVQAAEPFLTMKEVSAELGIPYWHIVRAVKAGLIPHHTLLNSKKFLRITPMHILKLVYIAHGWSLAIGETGRSWVSY